MADYGQPPVQGYGSQLQQAYDATAPAVEVSSLRLAPPRPKSAVQFRARSTPRHAAAAAH